MRTMNKHPSFTSEKLGVQWSEEYFQIPKPFVQDKARIFTPIGHDENMIWTPIGQEEAMSKAENMLQLIGYPDWLPEEAELDAYYE
jgi:hypothetical protein